MNNDDSTGKLSQKELANSPFFYIFTAVELEKIIEILTVKTFETSQYIVKEGDAQTEMYFLLQGRVSVLKKNRLGRDDALTQLTAPQVFGEMALVSGGRRSATIKAMTHLVVAELKSDDFENLIDAHPRLAVKMLRKIADMMNSKLQKLNVSYIESKQV